MNGELNFSSFCTRELVIEQLETLQIQYLEANLISLNFNFKLFLFYYAMVTSSYVAIIIILLLLKLIRVQYSTTCPTFKKWHSLINWDELNSLCTIITKDVC